jgi:predicted Rossmann-fold nucleotide-binding protein
MTQGIRILGLSSDQKTSEYVEDNYDFKHFVIRKMGLYNNCLGIAVFPGGFGTMDEFFEVWSRKLPMVLIGKSYWQPIIDAVYENWRKKGWLEMIEEKPFITDSVDEAMDHLRRAKGRAIKESAKTMETAVKDMESALRTIRGWQPAVVIIGQSELSDNAEADIVAGITSKLLANDIPVRSATANQYLREALEKAAGDKKETLQAVLTVPEGTVVKERPNRIVTHYVSNHHVLITENARAFVFLPGRVKTLNRLFDIVAVMQTGKIEKRPIILIDRKFWQPIKDAIVTAALEYPTAKLIKPEDAELLHIVDTADEAIRIIRTVVTSVPAPAGRAAQSAVPIVVSPDSERIHATNFQDALTYIQTQPQSQPLIVALGTSWIEGYKRSGDGRSFKYLQGKNLNELIASARNYCESKGIPFIVDDDDKLPARINAERAKKGKVGAKVVVLAGKDTVASDEFLPLRNDQEKAFIVGVDNQELTIDSYIRLMEMLTLALKLAAGLEISQNATPIKILKDEELHIYIFIPLSQPMNYEQLKQTYEVQKFA